MASFTAFLDANVLYSMCITDLAIRVALADFCRVIWSDGVHNEWTVRLRQNQPHIIAEQITRRRMAMDAALNDCLITEYEHLIPSLTLPDAKDRHVLAAAIVGRADVIVTKNLKDFPDTELAKFGIEAQHPDTFLNHQMGLDQPRFIACAKAARQMLKRPSMTPEEYIKSLDRAGLQLVAFELARFQQFL